MKRSSLQWKLTLWFSTALVLMAVLTFIVVFFVMNSATSTGTSSISMAQAPALSSALALR